MIKYLSLCALVGVCIFSLLQCPHSKVEESFNLQATHDLYYYGLGPAIKAYMSGDKSGLDVYDHLRFPGVVPRTFLGPLFISIVLNIITYPIKIILDIELDPLTTQTLARGVLLSFNIYAFYRLSVAANFRFGNSKGFLVGRYFLFITACQFHIPFYSSRMLPNSFALGLVTHSYADWFESKVTRAVVSLTAAAVVFRCDVIILLATVGITLLLRKEIPFFDAIKIGVVTVIASLVLTVPIDSLMWQRFLWPEGEVLLFNTVENRSSEYGTSPWHWYFVQALPKGLLLPLLLIPLSFTRLPQVLCGFRVHFWDLDGLSYFIPVLAFIGLYSILPHKEIRFIFVTFPMFNVFAAKTIASCHKCVQFSRNQKASDERIISKKHSILLASMLYLGCLAIVFISFLASFAFIQLSKKNYPGGEAIISLKKLLREKKALDKEVNIYIDVASTMTGVSLFGQSSILRDCPLCKFQKGGYEENNQLMDTSRTTFDYVLSEHKDMNAYKVIKTLPGFPSFDFRNKRIATSDAIHILKRKV